MSKKQILLVTREPWLMHSSVLQSQGYQVEVAGSIDDGRSLWRARKYDLVLIMINGDLSKAIEFCEEVKRADTSQMVALLAGWHTYVPEDGCPDDVIDRADPGLFVSKVSTLIGPALN